MSIESIKVYLCEEPGQINETTADELMYIDYPVATSQFCIVRKYAVMRDAILPNFNGERNLPYAYPEQNVKKKEYYGIDREELLYTPEEMAVFSETQADEYLNSLENKQDLELIFVRAYGQEDSIPSGYTFYGYDVSYPVGELSDGFSIIGDCLFWGRWHGCDREGTMFANEYKALNRYGLFNTAEEAYLYMVKYLNQNFAGTGEYILYEVYGHALP